MSLRSPLGKVRGLGSAKEGVGHWWAQRVTAIALAPLSIFFVLLVLYLRDADYTVVRNTLANPVIAILLISFVLSLFYHGQLGLQTIIEDYVHTRGLEVALLLFVKFAAFLCALASLLALSRIALI
jgi:succinate dehydrogenase / fumarate reductase, membrane anchor subunit